MDFGSKYIYKYDHSSDESVSDDDEVEAMETTVTAPSVVGLAASASSPPPPPRIPAAAAAAPAPAAIASQKRKKRLRKADTNVVSVKFNRLLQPGEMHAGDPVRCSECGALASHLSQIQAAETTNDENRDDSPSSKWRCDFCSHINTVDIDQGDLPRKDDATYLIAPAPVVHGSDMTGVDDSIVIFLIDTSGSMSATTLVRGNFRLPNALREQERAAANFDGERMQRDRHQTYVSRLQGVQMAVDANLDKLAKETPTRRAALLTFNHEITYYGDGTRDEPLVIRGDKLNNAEDLLREAERELNNELKPVAETKTRLTERVYDLEEGGQTALGPAVLLALSIASKRRGSKLVICTDGLANRGLGSLELAQDGKVSEEVKLDALNQGNEFYGGLTERAREQGVSISVITIKGTTCLLSVIGQMADGTSGNVTIVDLLNIRDEFASILEQKVTATNVEATLIVHRGLYIRDPDRPDEKLEQIKRDIGNVTNQTEVTFEFGVRNKNELKEKYQIDLDQLKQLPFQVQVTYTAADGSKALRVLTQLKETTENRTVAEINAYRGVIAQNHIQSTANDMMMYNDDDDDDDDDESASHKNRSRLKWSSPMVQNQRMAYMSKLGHQKREHLVHDTDRFSESFWSKASSELKSTVDDSKQRRTAAKMSKPVSHPTAAAPPSLFSRVTSYLTMSSTEAKAEEKSAVPKPAAATPSKKKYGFGQSNLLFHTDRTSENLYRLKNISSDQMCSSSSSRDEVERPPALALEPAVSIVLENDKEEDEEEEKEEDEEEEKEEDEEEEKEEDEEEEK